jgi:hypothetical protein
MVYSYLILLFSTVLFFFYRFATAQRIRHRKR